MIEQLDECQATATAPVNHRLTMGTYGHVCRKPTGHDRTHECACSRAWRDSERVAQWADGQPMGRRR